MNPDPIIKRIRESYIHSKTVYTQGGCYQFHLILKEIFPQSICWYDSIVGHVITEIDGKFYDITGEVGLPDKSYLLSSEPRIAEEAKTWRFDWGDLSNSTY